MSAILVTGGAGFVGGHFVKAAHAAGRQIVVLDDLSGGARSALPADVALVRGDIGDAPLVRRLIQSHGITAIAHFAGKIQVGESVLRPELYFDVNLCRTLTLLDVARQAGVQHVLFSSTAAVYGIPTAVPIVETAAAKPVNPYGASKLGVEHVLDAFAVAHDLHWAALRYFNAAGAHPDGTLRESHDPETHLIPLVLDATLGRRPPVDVLGDDYPTPDGTCVRDYIHVVDLAEAHLLALAALERGEMIGALNLGTGRGHSVAAVLEVAEEVTGLRVPWQRAPRRAGDPPQLVADANLAREKLGWRARRSDLPQIMEDALRSRR